MSASLHLTADLLHRLIRSLRLQGWSWTEKAAAAEAAQAKLDDLRSFEAPRATSGPPAFDNPAAPETELVAGYLEPLLFGRPHWETVATAQIHAPVAMPPFPPAEPLAWNLDGWPSEAEQREWGAGPQLF